MHMNLVKCDILDYVSMNLVNDVNLCGDMYMMMFVIFGDGCTLGDFS